jgi:hypothetical protein
MRYFSKENAYNKFRFTNWENSTDESVSYILLFLNTLQVKLLNYKDLKRTWKVKWRTRAIQITQRCHVSHKRHWRASIYYVAYSPVSFRQSMCASMPRPYLCNENATTVTETTRNLQASQLHKIRKTYGNRSLKRVPLDPPIIWHTFCVDKELMQIHSRLSGVFACHLLTWVIGGTYILQLVQVGEAPKIIRYLPSEIIVWCPPGCTRVSKIIGWKLKP